MPTRLAFPLARLWPPGGHLGLLRVYAVAVVCTGLCELLRPHADVADLIMVYVAGVVYVALRESHRTSVLMVLLSTFLFDLLFVPPRWGMNPLHPSHVLTFVVMLAVGLLTSHLSARVREQSALAERRAGRAQALSDLASQLSAARSPEDIATAVSTAAMASLGVRCTLAAAGTLHLEPGTRVLAADEHELIEGFARQARLAVERSDFERKSAEALVATETERLRNTLLSGISHDLRTPLTTIVGAATSLLEQEARLDARMRQSLTGSILEEAHRLHERVSHLLDLTRLQEGAVELRPEWCPADDLVAETLRVLRGRLAQHAVQVEIDPADAIVWCDPTLLEQALANMLDNAARYTPPGSRVTVRVALAPGEWVLTVADDGPGLPPGSEETILGKFKRGRGAPAGTGFGLGLAIVVAVTRLHGGTVQAHSAQGAVFTLRLPQPAPPSAEEA